MHCQIRPKRIFVSLGTNDWTAAEMEVARLYERGLLPPVEVGASMLDPDAITVPQAGKRYLESRTGASLDPIEKDTLDHYAFLIEQRLFPYCELNGIHFIRDFENRDVCSRFAESWRQLRGGRRVPCNEHPQNRDVEIPHISEVWGGERVGRQERNRHDQN